MKNETMLKAMIRSGDQFLGGRVPNVYNTINEHYTERNPMLIKVTDYRLDQRREHLESLFYKRVTFLKNMLFKDCFKEMLTAGNAWYLVRDNVEEKFERFGSYIDMIPFKYSNLTEIMRYAGEFNIADDAIGVSASLYNSFTRNIVGLNGIPIHKNLKERMAFIIDYIGYILILMVYEGLTVYAPAGFTDSEEDCMYVDNLQNTIKTYEELLRYFTSKVFQSKNYQELQAPVNELRTIGVNKQELPFPTVMNNPFTCPPKPFKNLYQQIAEESDDIAKPINNFPLFQPIPASVLPEGMKLGENEKEFKLECQILYRVRDTGNVLEIKPANQLSKKENETFSKTLYTQEALMRDYGDRIKAIADGFKEFENMFNWSGISFF